MLPANWYPACLADLVRMGPREDGGYVIPQAVLGKTELLLGLGLSTDWRFEQAFRKQTGCDVLCYDHTVHPSFWARHFLRTWGQIFRGRRPLGELLKYPQYRRFFRGANVKHHRIKIGYDGQRSSSIHTLLQQNAEKNIFLKIDIEGWEYRVMQDLLEARDHLLGFVVELHDVDIHKEKISDFIATLHNYKLVHIHPNNHGGVDPNGDPLVVEMTFLHDSHIEPVVADKKDYPVQGLDFPSYPEKPDIALRFEQVA